MHVNICEAWYIENGVVFVFFSIRNERVLITGASGAIGRAIASTFLKCGANVAISGTREQSLIDLVTDLQAKAQVLRCDLSRKDEVESLVDRASESLGGLDILINNAGINKDMLLGKMKESDLDEVMKINLNASFILARDAISVMASNRYGRIINISSVVGFTGNIGQVNYCSSKAALVGMSKAMALEVARKGITVNCIAPGAINSPMMERLSEANREKFISKIPMQKIGEPEDVANACLFLAARESSYITGQTIHVNGGMLML
jgi:3-oxoacyl-[acyl-carrier protein] reductase